MMGRGGGGGGRAAAVVAACVGAVSVSVSVLCVSGQPAAPAAVAPALGDPLVPRPSQLRQFEALYVFGDSWIDDNGVAGTWKSGAAPPSPPNAWRYADGPTWPHYLARHVLQPAARDSCDWANASTPRGVECAAYRNYAMGGACTHEWPLFAEEATAEAVSYCSYTNGTGVNVPARYFTPGQIDLFEGDAGRANTTTTGANDNNHFDNALFVVSVGGNDVNMLMNSEGGFNDRSANILDRPEVVAEKIVEGMEALIELGAKNFLVANIPAALLVPRAIQFAPKGSALFEVADEVLEGYALELNKLLEKLGEDNKDVSIRAANMRGCLREIHVGKYGGYPDIFKNFDTPCAENRSDPNTDICSNPEASLWWDSIHPTTSYHRFVADLMIQMLSEDEPGMDICMMSPCFGDSFFSSCFDTPGETVLMWFVILLIIFAALLLIWCCCVQCNVKVRRHVAIKHGCCIPVLRKKGIEDIISGHRDLRRAHEASDGSWDPDASSSEGMGDYYLRSAGSSSDVSEDDTSSSD